MAIEAAQFLGNARYHRQHLYTLKFKNGQILKHQDLLALCQYRCDGRLASYLSEATAGLANWTDRQGTGKA